MLKTFKVVLQALRQAKKYGYQSTQYDTPRVIDTVPMSSPAYFISSNNQQGAGISYTSGATDLPAVSNYLESKADERKEILPVAVVNDLLTEFPVMILNDLKLQIKSVEKRIKWLLKTNGNVSDEQRALAYLKARTKWMKYKHLFCWKITTADKIQKLLKEYKLRHVSFSGYSRNVPMEAIDEIEQFALALDKIIPDTSPELMLIIDDGGKETRKDPILLAKSPFGNWFYVLGAWDKEVQYIDDLIYYNK